MAGEEAVKRTPGMGTLINALSAESTMDRRPVKAYPLVGLPRPRPFARLLAVVAVVLIASLAGLMLLLAHVVTRLLADIASHEKQAAVAVAQTLPPSERLVDDAAFQASLAEHPGEATQFYVARARGLSAVGRYDAAAASFAQARQLAINGLPAGDLIAEADALAHAARYQEAMRELLRLDFASMDNEVRAQAVELIGRCHLAEEAEGHRSTRVEPTIQR